jgi:hypothetical protein
LFRKKDIPIILMLNFKNPRILQISLAVIVAILSGCAVANHAIQTDFTAFNSVVQYNQSQQMLLNIVRIHFRESPEFLQAASLSASYESTSVSGAGITGWGAPTYPTGGAANISYTFATKPTITYTPIDGKNFVQQFLYKITPDTCSMLIDAGWPVKKIGDLLIDRVDLKNGEAVVNKPTSPTYPKFKEWIKAIQEAQSKDQLEIRSSSNGIVIHTPLEDRPVEALHFRSLADVMFVAAKNVETPASQKYFARDTDDGTGEIFIHSSRIPPFNAMISVWYRGHFYSISNNDLKSKDTFALLMQLYRLQAAPAGGTPVLTIPVK